MRGRGKGGGRLMADIIRLENNVFILVFFVSVGWLNRFGSVQSVSDFRNQNRTEPEIFCDFLIC